MPFGYLQQLSNLLSVLLVVIKPSGPRVKASCKSALTPPPPTTPTPLTMIYSTVRSKAVVPVLVLLFVALWFILRGYLFYVLLCVILFLCFSVPQHCDYLAWGRES